MRRNTAPLFNATLFRNFRIAERQMFEVRGSAYNIANTPVFGPPNVTPTSPLFGVVPITQINLPRAAGIGLRYSFQSDAFVVAQ